MLLHRLRDRLVVRAGAIVGARVVVEGVCRFVCVEGWGDEKHLAVGLILEGAVK